MLVPRGPEGRFFGPQRPVRHVHPAPNHPTKGDGYDDAQPPYFKRASHLCADDRIDAVVRGTADVTRENVVQTLTANQSFYIPIGEKHRLANPGEEILEIIEVQTGELLSEDDIERFDDQYGR